MPMEGVQHGQEPDDELDLELELEGGEEDSQPSVDGWKRPLEQTGEQEPAGNDDEPGQEPGEAAAGEDEEHEKYSESVQKRIAALTRKYREAERQREAAVAYGKSLTQQIQEANARLEKVDKGYVGEYEGRVSAQIEAVKRQLKDAMDAHDSAAVVEAQSKLGELTYELQRARTAKRMPRQSPQLPPEPWAAAPQQPPQPAAPDPKAEAWAEKNPWFGEDRALTSAAMAVHQQLVADEGYDPSSDDYYQELDRRMAKYTGAAVEPAEKQARRPGQAVSGGQRTPAAQTGRARKQVKLSASEIAIAKKLGISNEQYAREKMKLEQQANQRGA